MTTRDRQNAVICDDRDAWDLSLCRRFLAIPENAVEILVPIDSNNNSSRRSSSSDSTGSPILPARKLMMIANQRVGR